MIIGQYEVSVSFPSIVGGTGTALKYFGMNPPASLWNTGVTGVNTPQTSNNFGFGFTPSATNASGQLQLFTGNGTPAGVTFAGGQIGSGRLLGNRFRVYASGEASSATTPTITPIIQLNKGTIASPTYVTLGGNVASGALVANQAVSWSIACDVELGPSSASLHGFMKYTFSSTPTGTAASGAAEAAITAVNGLTLTNAQGVAGFGLVVGITFGTSDASNTSSLYEFKIVQD